MRKFLQKIIKKNIKNVIKWIYIIFVQSIQTITIALIAIYFNKIYEFALIVIGFQIGRAAFGKSYHSSTIIFCTLLSCFIFGAACYIVPTSNISLTIQGIFGVLISYAMYRIEIIREELEK